MSVTRPYIGGTNDKPGKYHLPALIGIFLIASLARMWHISWGLPEILEEATPMTTAWNMWNWNSAGLDLNPHFFHYPALTFYLNFIVQAILYFIGHLIGSYPTLESFSAAYRSNPAAVVIAARMISVLFDFVTIVIAYRIVRMLVDRNAGLLAAAILAINPLLIRQAHMITVDTPLVFFSMLSFYWIAHAYHTGEKKYYHLAGVGIGLAAATKYTGAMLLVVLVGAHITKIILQKRKLRKIISGKLILAVVIAMVIFCASNPCIFLDYNNFAIDFSFEQHHMTAGHFGLDENTGSAQYYFLQVLPENLGWGFYGLAAVSLIILGIKIRKDAPVFYLYILVFNLPLLIWKMRAERYILPIFPLLIIIGAIGAVLLWRDLSRSVLKKFSGTSRRALAGTGAVVFLAALMAQPVYASIKNLISYSFPDTRTLAKEWIADHLPPHATVAMAPLGISLPSSFVECSIPYTSMEFERFAPFYDARWFEDCDIVVGSSFDYSRYQQDTATFREFIRYYYDSLRTNFTLLQTFAPADYQPGPNIWLYRSPNQGHDSLFSPVLIQRLTLIGNQELLDIFCNDLARVLVKKGLLMKCEQVLETKETLDSCLTCCARAMERSSAGDSGSAWRELEAGLRLTPDHAQLLFLKGQFLIGAHRLDEAAGTIERAMALGIRSDDAYFELAAVYAAMGHRDKAIEFLTSHHGELSPNSERAKTVWKQIVEVRGGG